MSRRALSNIASVIASSPWIAFPTSALIAFLDMELTGHDPALPVYIAV